MTTLLFAGTMTAFAATQSIQVSFDNIKIAVDGKVITPKDASGNVVQPFIYNGTTYLPIRAIGEAIGKEVNWDQTTKTASLGGAPTATTVFYTDFTTVPDFGAAIGVAAATSGKTEKGGYYAYNYGFPKESYDRYAEVLKANGFVFRGDMVEWDAEEMDRLVYEKGGVYVTMAHSAQAFIIYLTKV